MLQNPTLITWLIPALLSATLAALGYFGKQVLEWRLAARQARMTHMARLAELQSMLRASYFSFTIQNDHASRLLEMIERSQPELAAAGGGLERIFSRAYRQLSDEERELHALIRSLTINSLQPVNQAILAWLKSDQHFKTQWQQPGLRGELARQLLMLEAHILLWHAKYIAWIPDRPEHALVYMADEEEHGVGFPHGIEDLVQQALQDRSVF